MCSRATSVSKTDGCNQVACQPRWCLRVRRENVSEVIEQGIRVELSAHSNSSNPYLLQRWITDVEQKDCIAVVQTSLPEGVHTSNQQLLAILKSRNVAWLELIMPCMFYEGSKHMYS